VTICEDIWTEHYLPRPFYDVEPVRGLIEQGAQIIVNLSASPFTLHKPAIRREMVGALARAYQRPICYCNAVGGNDQLIFDGNSIAVNSSGELIAQLASFQEDEAVIDTDVAAVIEFREGKTAEELFFGVVAGSARLFAKVQFQIRSARPEWPVSIPRSLPSSLSMRLERRM